MTDCAKAHVVGSMLRPHDLLECATRFHAGAVGSDVLKRIEDRAVDEAIAVQQRAGIDVITDGEQRRLAFGDVIAQSVSGIRPTAADAIGSSALWHGGDAVSKQLKISSPTGGIIVERLRRLKSKASQEFQYAQARASRPIKVTLPSPTMFLASWSPQDSRAAYSTFEDMLRDVVEILREEVAALVRLGCRHVQFDAPELTFAIEGESSFMLRALGVTREAFCDQVVEHLNAAAAVPEVDYAVHLCRGNARGHWHSSGGYGSIAGLVFPRLARFRYVLLEYDSERAGGFEPLGQLPKTCSAVLGLITTKSGVLEAREMLEARIDEAARYFPREQLGISPQCGFASDAGGNPLTFAEQEAKLRLVGEVAREVLLTRT